MASRPTIEVRDIPALLDYVYDHARNHAVMLIGGTGVGKTQATWRWANERNLRVYAHHPVVYEPVDIQGIPVPKDDGTAVFLPFSDLWPWEPGSVLFLDEFNRASVPTMNALLRVVLERRVGGRALPDDVFIIAACNPPAAGSHVNTLSPAMIGRWLPVYVNASVRGWIEWAATAGIHPDVISYIRKNQARLVVEDDSAAAEMVATPNPRNWAKVSDIINGNLGNSPSHVQRVLIEAAVGVGAATEFLAWREMSRNLPEPALLYAGVEPLPGRSPDMAVAAASSVASWMIEEARGKSEDEAVEFIEAFLNRQVADEWPAEYVTLTAIMLRKGLPVPFVMALAGQPAWGERYGRVVTEYSEEAF